MAHARLRQRLPALVARPLARRTLTVPEDLPLAEAVRRAQEAEAGSIVTVTPEGIPVGIVSEAAVTATPAERRPWVAVSAVARTIEEGLTLPATVAGEDLILAISRRPADEYLLVEADGRIYGRAVDRRRRPGVSRQRSPLSEIGPRNTRVRAMSEPSPDVPAEAWSGVHRGPLREGEWVRLVDNKGRKHNFELSRASGSSPTGDTSTTTT